MNRGKIRALLLQKGFTFQKTTKAYPARRGDEDIYTYKPVFKYTFRVSLVDDKEPDFYGLYVGFGNTFRDLNAIVEHDIDVAEVWGSSRPLPMWTGTALMELINCFPLEEDSRQN